MFKKRKNPWKIPRKGLSSWGLIICSLLRSDTTCTSWQYDRGSLSNSVRWMGHIQIPFLEYFFGLVWQNFKLTWLWHFPQRVMCRTMRGGLFRRLVQTPRRWLPSASPQSERMAPGCWRQIPNQCWGGTGEPQRGGCCRAQSSFRNVRLFYTCDNWPVWCPMNFILSYHKLEVGRF